MIADVTKESNLQTDIINQICQNGWVPGTSSKYDRERALYPQDALTFVQITQPQEWEKFTRIYPNDTERHFLDALVAQLKKADANATDLQSRTYGTLGCCVTASKAITRASRYASSSRTTTSTRTPLRAIGKTFAVSSRNWFTALTPPATPRM